MIKAASIQTTIIDDIDLACRDLKSQLDTKLTLLSNSVGIVQCDPEFIELGIMGPLYKALGIPLVGGTTVTIATNDTIGNNVFAILVLTSDDVEFATSHTVGLPNGYSEVIEKSIKTAMASCTKPLRLVMIFPTLANNEALPGDCYVEAVEKICGNVPVFGTLSVDDTVEKFERSMSVFNADSFRQEMSYVLLFGDVKPRFFVATVPPQSKLAGSDAIITRAEGSVIHEINNVSTIKYFESIGLASGGKLKKGVYFVPLLLTAQDANGTSRTFVRAIIDFNADGSATCRGRVPEGSRIDFGSLQSPDILSATSEVVTQINSKLDIQAAILFSCIVRQMYIGPDATKELAQIKQLIHKDIPFMVSYSGGEISPISHDINCSAQNWFHNYSLIACLL